MTRRELMAMALAAASAKPIRLEIGNYGMQSLGVEEAIALIRRIGYDGAELCLMPGWPSEAKALSAGDRQRLRGLGFPIPTLIESFNLLASESAHRATLDRIRMAAELARDLNSDDPPLLQTVLGGKPEEWPQVQAQMAARLSEWGRVAAQCKLKLAVKAHANSAVDSPAKLVSLLDQVRNPAVRAIYDYGHFQVRGLSIEESMDALLARSAFLTVKDSRLVDGKVEFLLPGEGTVDYTRYFRKVKSAGWKGWVLVEISSQVFRKAGYDAVRAAERSYSNLAPVLAAEGLR